MKGEVERQGKGGEGGGGGVVGSGKSTSLGREMNWVVFGAGLRRLGFHQCCTFSILVWLRGEGGGYDVAFGDEEYYFTGIVL